MKPAYRILAVLCIVALLAGAAAGTTAADPADRADATDRPVTDRLVVELDANGNADAVAIETFDLTVPRQRAVFENVRDSEQFRRAAAERFRGGMQSISEEAGADRRLRVGEVTVETGVGGETGAVAYRFRWENLAAVEGDRIVLSEPFSAYPSLDRELVVVAPEGYELEGVSPRPERRADSTASWPGMTEFGDRFEVVAAPSETHGDGPVAIGIAAVLLSMLFLGRER
jgi:hypothetical protein